jgi:Domain of unknown function (DUF4350)
MSTAAAPARAAPRNRPPASRGLTLPVVGAIGAVALIIIGAVIAGRRDEQLPSVYGRRRGGEAARSVNGTAVLADVFRQDGRRVTTISRFSPKLNDFDVLVWIPNDFKPPDDEHRQWLEAWLKNDEGSGAKKRTLIYVGRDYDAAVDYWQRIVPQTPEPLGQEAVRRQSEARAAFEHDRSEMPTRQYARWFTARRDEKPRKIDKLGGPWAKGIDAKKANIHLEGRLAIPTKDELPSTDDRLHCEPLLTAGRDALVFRVTDATNTKPEDSLGKGEIFVVANGSLVLNYPLVNHEHRKLAAKLVEESSAEGDKIAFIESQPGGPPILKKEPTGGFPTVLELLKVWPLNAILLHLTFLGIVLCLARWPIFGRPRELPADSPTDFGKHVAALGKLLARTKDRNYAHARLVQYRQIAERRSGRSHLKNK